MLTPDVTIMSVGTEITYGNSMIPDDGWVEILNQKWDKKIVLEEASKYPELTLQVLYVYSYNMKFWHLGYSMHGKRVLI